MVKNNNFNMSDNAHYSNIKKVKLSAKKLRSHCVSVRLNSEELSRLNEKRGRYHKGEWLRLASLEKLPPVVPAINLEAWKSLSDISKNLNKLIMHLDAKSIDSILTKTELFAVKRQISELRISLITTKFGGVSHEGDAKDQER